MTIEQIINHRALAHLTEEQRQHILTVSLRLGGEYPFKEQSSFANAQRALHDKKDRILRSVAAPIQSRSNKAGQGSGVVL